MPQSVPVTFAARFFSSPPPGSNPGTGPTGSEFSPDGPGTVARRILVVEDDPDVADLAVEALGRLGYDVVWAANATVALAALQDGPAFDLVFSDIVMPGGISGVELATRVQARWPDLPVILTTGYNPSRLGADVLRVPVLIKPYSLRELSRVIAELLRGPVTAPPAG